MLRHLVPAAALAMPLILAAPASAMRVVHDEESGRFLDIGGYAQAFAQYVQNPCIPSSADACRYYDSPDGFGLSRARLMFDAGKIGVADMHLELSAVPDARLLEAEVGVQLYQGLRLRVGLMRIPLTYHELVSESRLQFGRASLVRFTPGRQLGVSLRYQTPEMGPLPAGFIRVDGGVFDGEAVAEQVQPFNIDSEFQYAGRLEISPFGVESTRSESDLRPMDQRSQPLLTLGGAYSVRRDDLGSLDEGISTADLTLKWYGVYLHGAWLNRVRDYDSEQAGADQSATGWNVQLGFMVPGPWIQEHLQLAARVEQYDPAVASRASSEDALLPSGPGSGPAARGVDEQAQRIYAAMATVFLDGNDFKVSAIYTHRQAVEDWALAARNADVVNDIDDDTWVLEATYRF